MKTVKRKGFFVALAVGLMVAVLPLVAGATVADSVVINEIEVSTASTDWEFVEIYGTAGTDLSGYTLVEIESDNGSSAGTIDKAIALSGTIPSSGFWVAMSPAGATEYGVTGDMAISNNSFENSTATYYLVSGFTGAQGDDLDTNNDGVLDSTPWATVADSLSIRDGGASDFDYGAMASVGPDGSFLPAGTFRCPDGPDGTFDGNLLSYSTADGTPGTPNCEPPPPPVEKFIHEIQGSGSSTPLSGVDVIIEGVVVGDFQGSDFAGWQLGGFFVQEEAADQDADPATSEGIFVYSPSPEVNVGDLVQVTGTAVEYSGLTEITDVTDLVVGDPAELPAATEISFPVTSDFDWERLEGMLVTFPQDLYISEFYNFDRYGEIVLTSSRQYQPTQVAIPGSPEAEAVAEANALTRVSLDDGRTSQNPDPAIHPNGEEFTLTNRFRGGDILQGVTGVVTENHGYKVEPTQPAVYVEANPRPTAPDRIKGQLRVASFNVLNFFTTIDDGSNNCGPTGVNCRGADSQEEFDRQLAKLVSGIVALDADVVGLQEIENDIYGADIDGSRAHNPILTLVEALNAAEGAGTWSWVGPFDDLAMYNDYPIRNEIIYRTSAVTPVGEPQTKIDEAFDKTRPGSTEPVGRRPVAQTFTIDHDMSNRGDRRAFTVVVNHFKSKGSSCSSIGDPYDPDGQANCNLTRVAQAKALLGFVKTLQETSGDPDVLVIGDLNSYAMEDPISAIKAGADGTTGTADDFTDLLQAFEGTSSYGYLFDGQLGSLDQALASSSLVGQVRGVTTFHINADEPDIFDYDIGYKQPAQAALYEPLPYRVSDHDPVIVGLKLIRQDHKR